MSPSIEELREAVAYDPETGALTWRVWRSGTKGIGAPAGGVTKPLGYVQLRFKDKLLYGHRVAFALVHGRWPVLVDHINHDKADNRIVNLRESDRRRNQQNRIKAQAGSQTGFLGVAKNKKRFMASIVDRGQRHHLGTHDTPQQAHEAYIQAKRRLHEQGTL